MESNLIMEPNTKELMECTHRITKSNFVQTAKQDDISNIHYNVIFLLHDLFNTNYMGINTMTFDYGGEGDLSTDLEIAFQGQVYFTFLNTDSLPVAKIYANNSEIKINRSLLNKGHN